MATLKAPEVVPLPSEDCHKLNKAFKGWRTDQKVITRVLGHRNASQRKAIRETYNRLYNVPLVDQLHLKLSGDFLKAILKWTDDPADRDARLANEALNSWNKAITRLQVIVEIACATSPNHLMAVKQAYCSLFETSLEEDIISNTPSSDVKYAQ